MTGAMSASPLVLIAVLGFAGLLLVAAITDLRSRLIPDWVSVAMLALYPLYA